VLETEQIADHTSGAQGNVTDSKVRLVKAGAIAGLDQSEGLWTLVEHYVVHGASNDVWGGVTAAEVRATDFGAALLVLLFTATTSVIGSLDHIRMTVYHRGAVAYGGKASLRWDKGYF
jgi:hypothetical protein